MRRKPRRRPRTISVALWEQMQARGWELAGRDGWLAHPRLTTEWPVAETVRLETERDDGNRKVRSWLGKLPEGAAPIRDAELA